MKCSGTRLRLKKLKTETSWCKDVIDICCFVVLIALLAASVSFLISHFSSNDLLYRSLAPDIFIEICYSEKRIVIFRRSCKKSMNPGCIYIHSIDLSKYTRHNLYVTNGESCSQFWKTNNHIAHILGVRSDQTFSDNAAELVATFSVEDCIYMYATQGTG